jgi:hypothetical protein
MSFPRLSLIALPVILGLPLLLGACTGAELAVGAASYGGDAASVAETGKTTADHFASIVSKKDCAVWRMFKNQDICRDRDMTHDVYHVSYDSPFRQQSEGGTEYSPPPHYSPGAPATSWDVAAYNSVPGQQPATPTAQPPATQNGGVADNNSPPAAEPAAAVAQSEPPHPAAPPKKKQKKKKVKPHPAPAATPASASAVPVSTPPSQGQVVSSR